MTDDMSGQFGPVKIRQMASTDLPAFMDLIEALAKYENLPPPDVAARERMARDAMADPPRFSVLLAERSGQVIGYAVFFETYSTFLAMPTLYLEDVFVREEERRKGVGRAFFKELAQEAIRRGCGRMEWQVLTWNAPAIEFYGKLEATRLEDWQPYRLTREQFGELAEND